MNKSAETLTLDIERTVGDLMHSQTEQHAEALLTRFAEMSDVELQRSFDGDLMEHPAARLGDAALQLHGVSRNRVLHTPYGENFITRNRACTEIDTQYEVFSSDPLHPTFRIRSLLRGHMDIPCTIDVSNDAVTVTETFWRRGARHDMESRRPEFIIPAITANMIWAVAQANRRASEGTQADADLSARALLGAQRRQDRGIVYF